MGHQKVNAALLEKILSNHQNMVGWVDDGVAYVAGKASPEAVATMMAAYLDKQENRQQALVYLVRTVTDLLKMEAVMYLDDGQSCSLLINTRWEGLLRTRDMLYEAISKTKAKGRTNAKGDSR